jgi:integrase
MSGTVTDMGRQGQTTLSRYPFVTQGANDMPSRRLTDLGIRNLRPGPTRREISDPGARGLYVVIQPSGRRGFALRYRFNGRPRKLTLTAGISLAAARKAAADAMYDVSQGRDPADERKAQRKKAERTKADTLRSVAEAYLAREGKRLRSAGQRERIFERLIFPVLGGGRPIGEIRRKDVVALLDHVEDKSGARMADYTLAVLRKLFNWHAVRDDEFISPVVRGMGRQNAKEHERSRTLSDDELRAVWTAAERQDDTFAAFVRFLLATAARRNEASQLTWGEIDGSDWLLPGRRNKVKLDLVRPLSALAQAILAARPRFDGCDYVFTNDGHHALASFARRKRQFDTACGVAGWTLHDLRRSARSLMSRARVLPDHAERCLGHVVGGVRGVYDRYAFHREKAAAFAALAAQIEQIVNRPQGNIVPLRG